MRELPEPPMIGRDTELRLVVSELSSGTGAVVTGPVGVGKTRLAREALAATSSRGPIWITATEAAASIPFAAVAGLLPPDGGADPVTLFPRAAAALSAGGERPVVIVDDAHLLDDQSAALVHHLVAERAVRAVLTTRAGLPVPDAVQRLWKDGDLRRVDLVPLSEEDVAALVDATLGGPAVATLHRWAFQHSEGNPLELREILAAAVATSFLEERGGLWQMLGEPPMSLRLADLVRTRLQDLDGVERRALELVALGEPVLRAALERAVPPHVLETLERGDFVTTERHGGEWIVRTAHPVLGELVRADLPVGTAVLLGRELAEVLAATGGDRASTAMRLAELHLSNGLPVEPGDLVLAAAAATSAFDHARSERLAAAAADKGGGAAAVVARAGALNGLGRWEEAAAVLGGFDGSSVAPNVAMAALRAQLFADGRRDRPAAELLSTLESAAAWHEGPEWSRTLDGLRILTLVAAGRFAEAAEQGDALGGGVTDPGTRAAHALAHLELGHMDEARRLVDGTGGGSQGDADVLSVWARARFEAGESWDEVAERVRAVHREALVAGDDAGIDLAAALLGELALGRGHAVTATRWLGEADAGLVRSDPHGIGLRVLASLARAEVLAGRDAGPTMARLGSLTAKRSWLDDWATRRAEAWVRAAGGELREARQLLLAAAADGSPARRSHLLHDALRLGEPASRVAAPLSELAAASSTPLQQAYAAHATAEARHDAEGLERAAASMEAIGADVLAAEVWVAAADAHRRNREPGRARIADGRAADVARRAEEPVTPRLARAAAAVTLSPREHEVASLASSGLTNAAIADRLALSVRTVESYLYRAMHKLDVGSRDQLGSALDRSLV